MNLILILQCCVYERAEQRVTATMLSLLLAIWSIIIGGLFMAISERLSWIRYIYYLSYIKVGTTPIKYTPQVCSSNSPHKWNFVSDYFYVFL